MPTCKGMDRNEGNVGVMKDPYLKKEIKKAAYSLKDVSIKIL